MSGDYTMKVSASKRDAILKAVERTYAHAVSCSVNYKAEEVKLQDWVDANTDELERIKDAWLLKTTVGQWFNWVEEETDRLTYGMPEEDDNE